MNPFADYDKSERFVQMFIRRLHCEPKENVWISTDEGKLVFETDVPETEVFVWRKPFDWEAFKSGKIAVKLAKENEKSFLEAAEKNGCKWRGGERPTGFILHKNTFYLDCAGSGYGMFGWSSTNRGGLEVVEW